MMTPSFNLSPIPEKKFLENFGEIHIFVGNKLDMGIIKKYESKSIQGFIHLVRGNRVYYDPTIQRRRVWKSADKKGYRDSLLEGTDASNIVLCDIKSSMEYSFSHNNIKDYNYFSNLWNQGYRYISIDGGNRTEFLLEEYNKINWDSPLSDEMFDFFNIEICLKFIFNSTKDKLHKTFINLNSNTSANSQERRNAMEGIVSDFIRKVGEEYSEELLKISKLNFSRMQDLELISQFLMYHQSKTTPIKGKGLTLIYKSFELLNEKEFLNTMSVWGKCINLIHETGSKITKTTSFNLFMFLLDMSREYRCVLNKDLMSEFVDKYLELDNKRIEDTFKNPMETNWTYLCRTMTKNLKYKFDCMYNDFLPFIGDYFYELDSKRLFTEMEKLSKCIETGGIVNRLDGSVEVYTPLQVKNGNIINGGHKDKPYSKGGKTTYDNLVLQTSSDNKSQSNKH